MFSCFSSGEIVDQGAEPLADAISPAAVEHLNSDAIAPTVTGPLDSDAIPPTAKVRLNSHAMSQTTEELLDSDTISPIQASGELIDLWTYGVETHSDSFTACSDSDDNIPFKFLIHIHDQDL